MALFLRDPLRDSLYRDPFYELDRALRPRYQPVRVRRADLDDLLPGVHNLHHFDQALSELQHVMNDVSTAIGQYQNDLTRDLGVGGMVQSRTEDGNLQYSIDVSQYKPEEINVKLCDDSIVVEGKTESSENDSYHKSQFKRWMKLPPDCKRENIKSSLTPDRKLLIQVPMTKPISDSNTRSIPIEIQKPQAVENTASGDKGQQQNQQNSGKK